MARHGVAFGNSHFRPAYSDRTGSKSRQLQISPALERKWFEFDRDAVSGVLDTLQRAIDQGATQMEMIAAEQIFDSILSKTFSRTARRLDRVLLELKRLVIGINGATGYPKPQKD
ncbi:MAG TPA: hypothetical protein VKV03_02815 [Candidatus Binataceae bacterium]|nr:hypothetical protein [Candidatus Binataceae bacterium]